MAPENIYPPVVSIYSIHRYPPPDPTYQRKENTPIGPPQHTYDDPPRVEAQANKEGGDPPAQGARDDDVGLERVVSEGGIQWSRRARLRVAHAGGGGGGEVLGRRGPASDGCCRHRAVATMLAS